ncbi:hypothetical protein RvY_16248 [Ramazzottius varieornatus]|uniref:Uncharacterized protein n=1 Tax=Ramazzottius varieornatus TaxID=947166 RepID=A0A1D1VXS5_RAMVA|nr:hypothetical protein RvY_16248 [Ramazzottius varieornatus]
MILLSKERNVQIQTQAGDFFNNSLRLHGAPAPPSDEIPVSEKNVGWRAARYLRFILPSIIAVAFCIDFGDWIVNGEENLHLQQTRIISMLTYLDSQFGLWLGASTTFVFISKSGRFMHCLKSLARSMAHLDMVPVRQARRRVKTAWIILGLLLLFSTFRAVYGIYEVSNPNVLWRPRRYFIWKLPSGLVAIVLRSFFFLSEVSVLPIYMVFIFVCAKYTECFVILNKQIKDLLKSLDGNDTDSPSIDGATFLKKLKSLSLKEVTLSQALADLDSCFSMQVLCFSVNNSLGVFSKIAKCFVSAAFVNCMDYIKFIMKSSMYVAALGLIIVFPAILHESDYCVEEGEVLVTLLQRTTVRPHSLSVAGIATLTRSFGVTVGGAFHLLHM